MGLVQHSSLICMFKHYACRGQLDDPFGFERCSVSSLVALGVISGVDGVGVSQSMNLIWHRPIHQYVQSCKLLIVIFNAWVRGRKLRILSTSVTLNGRIKTARCEVSSANIKPLCYY